MDRINIDNNSGMMELDNVSDIRELTLEEQQLVGAGSAMKGFAGLGMAGGIGAATFGAGWGSVGVGLAFAVSPVAVVAMGAAALYGGYQLFSD